MSAPALRCVNLSRWYGEVQGLSGLTLDFPTGVVGLLGPNGSGKTTLMRLVTGLIRPTQGHVEVYGTRMGPGSYEVFRRVGYSPGDDVHFETERAEDFLATLARLGGSNAADARRRAAAALDRAGLSKQAGKRLQAMSKGMRQRVKVAQALLFEPELLLLDEPLNGMDPLSRRQVMDMVRQHGASGGTVLFASHVLHEVEAVTDQVVLLHHGRLLAEGRLEEIRSLLDVKPRRITVRSASSREIAATLLQEDLVAGVSFGDEGHLTLDTRDFPELLSRLQAFGGDGMIQNLEIEDENLEAVFDLLVEGRA